MLKNWIKYRNSYLLYKINNIYYKIKEYYILKKYGDKELKIFQNSKNTCIWCKRYYRKNNKNINKNNIGKYFCCEKCSSLYNREKYQSFKHNNICSKHHNQILTYKNQCWTCYKNDVIKNNINKLNKFRIKNYFILKYLYGFKLYPTFRTSKDSWKGDKPAFEQNLVDNRVNWFVYIKFYVNNKGAIKPIVVGKSGSLNVNYSGSDLNFSVNNNDGPARQFINLNNFSWNYDIIFVRKVRNEKEAYRIENKIMNKFDLFGS